MISGFITQDKVLAVLKKLGPSTLQELCEHWFGSYELYSSESVSVRTRLNRLRKHNLVKTRVQDRLTVYKAVRNRLNKMGVVQNE